MQGGAPAPRVQWSGNRAEDDLIGIAFSGPGGAAEELISVGLAARRHLGSDVGHDAGVGTGLADHGGGLAD